MAYNDQYYIIVENNQLYPDYNGEHDIFDFYEIKPGSISQSGYQVELSDKFRFSDDDVAVGTFLNAGYHTLDAHIFLPRITDYYNNIVDTNPSVAPLGAPTYILPLGTFPLSGGCSKITPLETPISSGEYITKCKLYKNNGTVIDVPRVVCIELIAGGGAGGGVGGHIGASSVTAGGGGSGGYACIYIDTSYQIWHFRCGNKGNQNSGGDGSSGGPTIIWNDNLSESQTSVPTESNIQLGVYCNPGTGGTHSYSGDTQVGWCGSGGTVKVAGAGTSGGFLKLIKKINGVAGTDGAKSGEHDRPQGFKNSFQLSPFVSREPVELPDLPWPEDWFSEEYGIKHTETGLGAGSVLGYGGYNYTCGANSSGMKYKHLTQPPDGWGCGGAGGYRFTPGSRLKNGQDGTSGYILLRY